jgi:5-methylcytosine-specific restriction endonuclease McrA
MNFKILLLLFAIPAYASELPNLKITPGSARNVSIKQLCTTSTSLVRNVPESLKKDIYRNYGLNGNNKLLCKEGYEVDHLISLELGGDNTANNLWPQSFCGNNNAHDKDKLENELHRQICNNRITIEDAQECIRTNWIICFNKTFK